MMVTQVEKYLDDALELIRAKALYSATVDWDAVHAEARETAARARSYAGTHRLLHRVLKQAGGDHSHMSLPYRIPGTPERPVVGTATASPASAPLPEGKLVERSAYVTVPRLSRRSGGPLLAHRYATTGSRLVRVLAAGRPNGWIVDLRENTGGSMWPMLAAVAGLLDRGPLGHFLLPDGRKQAWNLNRRYISLDHRAIARVHGRQHRRDRTPIAILISSRTASAGEAVLVALQAQSPTRTFGAATAGMTTGNITRVLADGTRLMISTCHYADSAGRLITGSIQPDEPADPGADLHLDGDHDRDHDHDRDDALAKALAWIAEG